MAIEWLRQEIRHQRAIAAQDRAFQVRLGQQDAEFARRMADLTAYDRSRLDSAQTELKQLRAVLGVIVEQAGELRISKAAVAHVMGPDTPSLSLREDPQSGDLLLRIHRKGQR